jgi:hypothetical protein
MVKDEQVRHLFLFLKQGLPLYSAAAKAGMNERTASKYRREWKLPSQLKRERDWCTREDPFEAVWSEIEGLLEVNPGLQAKTIFEWLCREHTGLFQEGQLRTLQRKIRRWRALKGAPKEVFFPQEHYPGRLCQSDFTHMSDLGITICGTLFPHLIYHFVLTYSNWETGTVCFSESFQSLSAGLQNALWELGGVPKIHQSDRMTAAVHKEMDRMRFNDSYWALISHYAMEPKAIGVGKANENGDVEQRHYRFHTAVDQALMLRGSRDFESREEYEKFLKDVFSQLNAARQQRLNEELKVLRKLPAKRRDDATKFRVPVRKSSTIRVQVNTYSVHSRLIGEKVEARVYAEHIEVWYAQKLLEKIPRLHGRNKSYINYRHIIDWLVRKPGAFANYRYREELFPTSYFRMAYDALAAKCGVKADREYLNILQLAAKHSESKVNQILQVLICRDLEISFTAVKEILTTQGIASQATEVVVERVSLESYDELLSKPKELCHGKPQIRAY